MHHGRSRIGRDDFRRESDDIEKPLATRDYGNVSDLPVV
jgi:hypothetical protein